MTWRLDITRGRPEEATGLKQMPIRARTHKTGAGGMSASLIGRSGQALLTGLAAERKNASLRCNGMRTTEERRDLSKRQF